MVIIFNYQNMKKASIYIGANNTTKKVEIEKVKLLVGNLFEGYTIYEIIGYWHNIPEQSIKVEIIIADERELAVIRLCKELKRALNQEAIMVEIVETTAVFI